MKTSAVSGAVAAAVMAASAEVVPTVEMPLHLRYGRNFKMATSLVPPYPGAEPIEVCYDLGSPDFFVLGPHSTMNWGCRYLGCQGPCNVTVPDAASYDPARSATASALRPKTAQYGYGGGLAKLYKSDAVFNDTLTFANAASRSTTVPDVTVALAQYLQQRIGDNGTCSPVPLYDYSILGVAPYFFSPDPTGANTTGPSFRQDLLEQGQISAPVQSLWWERRPDDVTATLTGVGLLGGIDTSKYSGPLVKIPRITNRGYVLTEYYTNPANLSVDGVTPIEIDRSNDPTCILDSGAVGDGHNPVDQEAYFNATGLRLNPAHPTPYRGDYLSWPAPCRDIPADRFIEYRLAGADPAQTAVVRVPMRAYARFLDPVDEAIGWCTMAITLNGCGLNGPFLSAAFFAADDERTEIAIAQGGVAEPGSGVNRESVVLRIP